MPFVFAAWIELFYEPTIIVDNISADDIAQINTYYPPLAKLPAETIYEKMTVSSSSFPSGELSTAITVKVPLHVYDEIQTSFEDIPSTLHKKIRLNEESSITVLLSEKNDKCMEITFVNSQSAGSLIDLQTYCKSRSTSHHLIWLSYWGILIFIVVVIFFPYSKIIKKITLRRQLKNILVNRKE